MDVIIAIGMLIFSVSVHEAAHGWAAFRFGDPTAKELGRITLNPIKHIDPIFSIVVPAILYLTAGMVFGGAKPVPFDPSRMRPGTNIKKAIMWVAAAGPISNFIMAVIGLTAATIAQGSQAYTVQQYALQFYFINLLLGMFNLIPMPPLDGAKVLAGFLPDRMAIGLYKLERFAILFIIILIATPIARVILEPLLFVDYHLRSVFSNLFL